MQASASGDAVSRSGQGSEDKAPRLHVVKPRFAFARNRENTARYYTWANIVTASACV